MKYNNNNNNNNNNGSLFIFVTEKMSLLHKAITSEYDFPWGSVTIEELENDLKSVSLDMFQILKTFWELPNQPIIIAGGYISYILGMTDVSS